MQTGLLEVVLETIRLGTRRRDRYQTDKFAYTLESFDLPEPYSHVVVIVKMGWQGNPPEQTILCLRLISFKNGESMKAIHYDAEGDILSISFVESGERGHTGVELSDNIVLYLDPVTKQPLTLILSSYQAMLLAHAQAPLLLDGLDRIPVTLRGTILKLLQQTPLSSFLQLVDAPLLTAPGSRLRDVFAPTILQTVTAS